MGFGGSGGAAKAERERVGDVVKRREEKVKRQSELGVEREKKRGEEIAEWVKVKVRSRRKVKTGGDTGDGETGEGVKIRVKSRRKAKVDGEKVGDTEIVKVKRAVMVSEWKRKNIEGKVAERIE